MFFFASSAFFAVQNDFNGSLAVLAAPPVAIIEAFDRAA